jgi:hypothetical protein
MASTIYITHEERAQERMTSPHLQQAMAALHQQGLLVYEDMFDTIVAKSIRVCKTKEESSRQERSLFGLTQACELPFCLHPLLTQVAALSLGSRVEAFGYGQRRRQSHRKTPIAKRVDSFTGLKEDAFREISRVPIAALSIGIVLHAATLRFTAERSFQHEIHRQHTQKLRPGSVVLWDIHQSQPEIVQCKEAASNGTELYSSPEHPVWIQTVLGMRNFRCLQCGVFNLDVGKHIQGCSANVV